LSVTGESVNNTDPINPIVNAIPITGTSTTKLSGTIQIQNSGPNFTFANIIGTDSSEARIDFLTSFPSLDQAGLRLRQQNTNNSASSLISIEQTGINITRDDGLDPVSIIFGNGFISVQGGANFQGLEYSNDFSSNFVDNSLVSRKWVNDQNFIKGDAANRGDVITFNGTSYVWSSQLLSIDGVYSYDIQARAISRASSSIAADFENSILYESNGFAVFDFSGTNFVGSLPAIHSITPIGIGDTFPQIIDSWVLINMDAAQQLPTKRALSVMIPTSNSPSNYSIGFYQNSESEAYSVWSYQDSADTILGSFNGTVFSMEYFSDSDSTRGWGFGFISEGFPRFQLCGSATYRFVFNDELGNAVLGMRAADNLFTISEQTLPLNSSGTSGQYLQIVVNGSTYLLELLNP
jgi:hypothetical protein